MKGRIGRGQIQEDEIGMLLLTFAKDNLGFAASVGAIAIQASNERKKPRDRV